MPAANSLRLVKLQPRNEQTLAEVTFIILFTLSQQHQNYQILAQAQFLCLWAAWLPPQIFAPQTQIQGSEFNGVETKA